MAGPLSWAELERFTGDVAGRPLDRARPLWEMWLVDLADGAGVALVTKLHHSMMDGGAGADLMASIFDLEPDADGVAPADRAMGARHRSVHHAPGHRLGHLAGGPPAPRACRPGPLGVRAWPGRRGRGSASGGRATRCP